MPTTGGYYLNGGTFHDITVHDNSADNSDNDVANHLYDNLGPANRLLVDGAITVTNNLYVGQGSALLPANNIGPDVLATLTFTGAPGSIYNFGRIDPNPEVANANDWDRRRLDMRFSGRTTFEATDVFKDHWRLSNVTVNAGARLQAPSADSVSMELQWGSIDNNGRLNFGNGAAGFVNVGTRGDWSQQNDYYLGSTGGTGVWQMHDLLIGRNSSSIQPLTGGGEIDLQVQGDFENYDEFIAKNGNDEIGVVMAGTKKQYIRGNTTETNAGETNFHDLEINNANGLSDYNNTADVHFESFGGGTITYFLTGELKLTAGDLVTRDRSTNVVHRLHLRDTATVDRTGLQSNLSTVGSCYIEGPMSYEVASASAVSRDFPVGKSYFANGYRLGDARNFRLEVDHLTATVTTYTTEMFLDDRSLTYTWPPSLPETIAWISAQRYWNCTKSAGAVVQSANVTLDYALDERNDGVINAGALRIVKDDGAGNWQNISPLGPGGSANGDGNIRSQVFTAFSDFTLASVDGNQPLPVELLRFEARKVADQAAVQLEWASLKEVNLDRYIVERSLGGADFFPIGEVEAVGNSHRQEEYAFTDLDIPATSEILRYRLRLLDADGDFRYSEVRTLMWETEREVFFSLYPNPATDAVFLEVGGLENRHWEGRQAEVVIFDALGRSVAVLDLDLKNAQKLLIPAGQWAAGLYTVELRMGGDRMQKKLIRK